MSYAIDAQVNPPNLNDAMSIPREARPPMGVQVFSLHKSLTVYPNATPIMGPCDRLAL
jgi:hypothetical protein